MKDGMPLTEDNRAEQILLSCSGAGNCQSGGYIDSASNYLKSTGLPAEPYFPYTATDNACSNAVVGWQNYARKIGAWSYVNTAPANLTAIKNALAANGPLVTTMDVYSDFFSYVGGVYEYATGAYQGGHAILIVGYTDDPAAGGGGYFKVKNSWGAGWGSGGYFLIAYSQLGSPVYFGEWTLAYSIPTVPPPPAAPSSLSATPVSSGQINLAWTANAANQDGYKIERCTGSGCANFVQVATAAAGAVAYSNTGLSAGTYYSYRVRAYNTGGDSDYSNMAGASTMALQPPAAPASLQATAASASQINLAWADASNNEDGFRIERCAGNGCIDFLQIASVGAGVKSYSNSGLAVGAYTYRVRAYNAAGASGYSNTAAAATLCTCTLTPASLTFGPAGGTGTVTVNTAAGCAWTAATTASWITFSGSTSGSGTGGFTYLVPKTTARRTGTITVLGQTHSLVQSKK